MHTLKFRKILKKNNLSCAKIFINHSDRSSISLNKIKSSRLVLDDYVNTILAKNIFSKISCIFEIIFLTLKKKINFFFQRFTDFI